VFTGIIREIGTVDEVKRTSGGVRLRVSAGVADGLGAGDSVAVDGVCLTVASPGAESFEADVMNQTLSLTTLGALEAGSPVNLELPLRPTDRLGGHAVQGHVDGTGDVVDVFDDGFAKRLRIELPEELRQYVVERGSVAIEGVSLTVSALTDAGLEVSLIPETLERTTLGSVEPGDRLNIECDVLARYVQRQMSLGEGAAHTRGGSEGATRTEGSSNPFNSED
jgi:riboflavin synthase